MDLYDGKEVVSPATNKDDTAAVAATVADVCVEDGGSLQISLFKLFKLLLLLLVVTGLPLGDEDV